MTMDFLKLQLEPAGGIQDVAGWMDLNRLGGLSVMCITLRFCDRNIRRIGSLQSRIGIPSAEVICVAVVVGEGVRERGYQGPSKHHRLGIP